MHLMSLRNQGYERLTIAYVAGGGNDTAGEAVTRSLESFIRSPAGRALYFKRSSIGLGWRRIAQDEAVRLAADVVTVLPEKLTRDELTLRALSLEFGSGLPLRITVSNGMVAFTFPHALFDGTAGTVIIQRLVTGMDASAPVAEGRPVEQAALRTAMKKFDLTGIAGLRRARELFREHNQATLTPYQLPETLTKAQSVAITRWRHIVVDPETLARVAATVEQLPDGRKPARAPVSLKISSLVIATVKAVNTTGVDFPVAFPIDARRFGTKGMDIEGNFSPSVPVGRLLSGDWSATGILAVISSAIKTGLPVAWLLASALVVMKTRVQHPFSYGRTPASTPRVPFLVYLSMPTVKLAMPDSVFDRVDERFGGGGPMHADIPLGIFVEVSPLGDDMHISVRDETGLLDLDTFEAEFAAQVREFTGKENAR
jgi:hypothetical protein